MSFIQNNLDDTHVVSKNDISLFCFKTFYKDKIIMYFLFVYTQISLNNFTFTTLEKV